MPNELNTKEEKKGLFQIFNKVSTSSAADPTDTGRDQLKTAEETSRSRSKKKVPKKLRKLQGKSLSPSPSTKRKLKAQEQSSPSKKKKPNKMNPKHEIPLKTPGQQQSGATPTPSTPLSPQLEQLKADLQVLHQADLKKMIDPLKESINALLQIKNAWESSIQECAKVKEENELLNKCVSQVELENKRLTEKIRNIEDKMLESSVVLTGLPEAAWETEEATREKVISAIAHTITGTNHEDRVQQARNIPMKGTQRKGKYMSLRNRPVIVEFFHKSDADYLLGNRTNLPQGVYVDKHYSDETEKARRKLRPFLKAARTYEKFKGKCKLDNDKLVIRGKEYSVSTLHDLPPEINGFRVSSKVSEEFQTFGFFGDLNPFSNFHPSPFHIDGIHYKNSEQYIQHQKCRVFGDTTSENLVLKAETALECKNIGRDITNYDREKWKQAAKATCLPGILAKFEQNPNLVTLLKSTGALQIAECCRDKEWGTGIPLYDNSCINPSSWHSQGLLGEILEQVRSVLNAADNNTTTMETELVGTGPP